MTKISCNNFASQKWRPGSIELLIKLIGIYKAKNHILGEETKQSFLKTKIFSLKCRSDFGQHKEIS